MFYLTSDLCASYLKSSSLQGDDLALANGWLQFHLSGSPVALTSACARLGLCAALHSRGREVPLSPDSSTPTWMQRFLDGVNHST